MYWTADGLASTLVKIQPNYKVDTRLALKWQQVSSGNWVAVDRGATSDIYESEFTILGKQATIETVLANIETNRSFAASTRLITIGGCESTEHIFGEDVNHSGLTMTILSVSPIEQRSWQVYGATIRARAVSPTFTGSASLPTFRNITIGRTADQAMTINKMDTYYGTYTMVEHDSDSGTANLSLMLTLTDMQSMRRHMATVRGSNYTITSTSGLWNLFGPNRPITYPVSVKIIDWEDAGWFGLTHRILRLTIAEVI